MIQSVGNSTNPPVFLISDAGFGEDLRTNYAISGYQYTLFKSFLMEQNLNIENFWRTLLIKDEVPGYTDKLKGKKAKEEQNNGFNIEIAKYGNYLKEEINQLKPFLLIPTGELGFNFLTGLNGIRKFRGSVVPATLSGLEGNFKVMPILGPYPYLNQDYKMRFITRVDCGKIQRNLHFGPTPDNRYNIWIARSSNALRTFFERSYAKCMADGGFLVFDIETFMGIPTCSSFCFDGLESVCVPFLDPSIDLDNRVLMVDLIGKLLNSPIRKVNQNIKYDWKRNESYGFYVANVCGDTMLAASTLYCEFPKNLGFLTSIYTDIPYFKDEGREFDPTKHKKEQFYLYNAKDSLSTHQIYSQQINELVEKGTVEVYENLVKCMPIYRKMEERGIRIDQSIREKLLAKYESLFTIEEIKLKQQVGVDYGTTGINSLSSKQMRHIVFDILGYEKIRGVKTTDSGEPSTDEESLETLLAFGKAKRAPSTGPGILATIIACRKIHKVIEILELAQYPDHRFRCEFNLAGTETGRTSAGESTDELFYIEDGKKLKKTNLGHSLQTIGKHGFSIDGTTYGRDIRSLFVPSPGFVFVEIDLSQAEARVDAVLANNFDILSVFDGPIGIHKLTGSWVFDCEPGEIKKNVLVDGIDRYHLAKTVRHAGERNMKPNRLVMMTQRPLLECTKILTTFHKFQPEIREVFHREIKRAIDSPAHMLRSPNGRMRQFFDRIDDHTYNEGISQLPQSIVSDQTKFEGILPTFSETGIYEWVSLLTEQHDGVLNEVRRGREIEFAEKYVKNVQKGIDFRKCTLSRDFELVIPAEISIGENWLNLKEVRL